MKAKRRLLETRCSQEDDQVVDRILDDATVAPPFRSRATGTQLLEMTSRDSQETSVLIGVETETAAFRATRVVDRIIVHEAPRTRLGAAGSMEVPSTPPGAEA